MLLFGLDTSTLTLSAALVERGPEGDRVLERAIEPPPAVHSALLPRLIESMLDKAGVRASDLGGVVIGLGPGSFTGLRIGLATVKGVCYAAQVPLLGASSLAAMAVTAAPEVPEGTLLVPCLDARKGEVYCGFYRKKRAEVVSEAPEMALAPQALIERIRAEREAKVFGIGREAYPLLRELPPPGTAIATPDAAALVSLVREIGGYSKQSVFALEPHYVRPSDSEWTLKKRQPKQSLPTED